MLSKASTEKLISLSNDLGPQHQTVLTPQAKAALVKSIAHWRTIVKSVEGTGSPGIRISIGPDACALCAVFMTDKPDSKQCLGCPVMRKTGKPGCMDSPYIDARNIYSAYFQARGSKSLPYVRELRKLAYENTKKELDFLRGLLIASNKMELAVYEQNLKSVNTLIKEAGAIKDTILVYLDKHGRLPPGEQAPIKSKRKTKAEPLVARWDVECEAATIALPPAPVKVKVTKPKPKPIVHPPYVLKAIKALEDSIAHWQRLTDNKATSKDLPVGGTTCALCKLYYATDVRPCFSCPVKIKTGRASCINTPYIKAASSYTTAANKPGGRAQARKDGQAEVDFLKEVLRDVKLGKIVIPPPPTGKIKWRI